jgi:hypothetical protein
MSFTKFSLRLEPANFVGILRFMDVIEIFPVATDQMRPSDPCAKLILDAEIECGAFISATNQLFGEGAACIAGGLWVEELEASPNHFRGLASDWRIVTISAASRLADLMCNRFDASPSPPPASCKSAGRRAW